MPSDSSMMAPGETTYREPLYTSTNCGCLGRQLNIHEDSCIHKPQPPKKPGLYAGKRAWKQYRQAVERGKVI